MLSLLSTVTSPLGPFTVHQTGIDAVVAGAGGSLFQFHDGSQITTVGTVFQWDDLTGNGRHIELGEQGPASPLPSFSIGGRGAVRFPQAASRATCVAPASDYVTVPTNGDRMVVFAVCEQETPGQLLGTYTGVTGMTVELDDFDVISTHYVGGPEVFAQTASVSTGNLNRKVMVVKHGADSLGGVTHFDMGGSTLKGEGDAGSTSPSDTNPDATLTLGGFVGSVSALIILKNPTEAQETATHAALLKHYLNESGLRAIPDMVLWHRASDYDRSPMFDHSGFGSYATVTNTLPEAGPTGLEFLFRDPGEPMYTAETTAANFNAPLMTPGMTLFSVLRWDDTQDWVSVHTDSTGLNFQTFIDGATGEFRVLINSTTLTVAVPAAGSGSTGDLVLVTITVRENNNILLEVEHDEVVYSDEQPANVMNPWTGLTYTGSTSFPSAAGWGETLLFNRDLTTEEREAVQGVLRGNLIPPLPRALQFDASGDYLLTADDAGIQYPYSQGLSMSCWLRWTGTATGYTTSKIAPIGYGGWGTFIDAGALGFLGYGTPFGAYYVRAETTASYNDGNWHHLVVTRAPSSDVTGIKLYVDGVQVTQTNTNNTPPSGTNDTTGTGSGFQVNGRSGSGTSTGNPFDIMNATMVPHEMSASEVSYMYGLGRGQNVDYSVFSPSVHLPMSDESETATVGDVSGNGLNATVNGTPTYVKA